MQSLGCTSRLEKGIARAIKFNKDNGITSNEMFGAIKPTDLKRLMVWVALSDKNILRTFDNFEFNKYYQFRIRFPVQGDIEEHKKTSNLPDSFSLAHQVPDEAWALKTGCGSKLLEITKDGNLHMLIIEARYVKENDRIHLIIENVIQEGWLENNNK